MQRRNAIASGSGAAATVLVSVYGLVGDVVKLRQQRYYKPSGGIPTLSRDPGYLKILNVSPAIEGVDFRIGTENWKPRFQQ